ncbi:hypothetical protein BJV82DRAFT_589434 [Fennellomyces sp. T-0311]|nr:hypothetical protein BJV82DRAFT_589434 [Fennellomyces sp. T-0311]
MYVEYHRNQKEIHNIEGYTHEPGINIRLEDTEVPEFKPTWLVRVEDMELIPGSSINEHYWALSYSWNQSGEIFKKPGTVDEYDRIDEGKHTIVSKEKRLFRHTRTKVKFEGLIQQICKDFGIKYVWFDQMCINQGNHDEKLAEIKRMHLIYKSACCALALIPELKITGRDEEFNIDIGNPYVVQEGQWSTRIWTLEEAYMSKQVLFVGTNAYFWSNWINLNGNFKGYEFIDNIRGEGKWKSGTALWYAKSRTSSKAHDRIFALANIFPELKDGITFSYKQPLTDLMVQFYTLLAQKDHSIICFGEPLAPIADSEMAKSREEEAKLLPSWSGAQGAHVTHQWFKKGYTGELPLDYSVDERIMRLTCNCIPVNIKTVDDIDVQDQVKDPNLYSDTGVPHHMYEFDDAIEHVKCTSEDKSLTAINTTSELQESNNFYVEIHGLKATHFVPTRMLEEAIIVNTLSKPTDIGAVFSLTDECTECLILSGIRFRRFHPIVKKHNDNYKAIGVCYIPAELEFDSALEINQTFVIE